MAYIAHVILALKNIYYMTLRPVQKTNDRWRSSSSMLACRLLRKVIKFHHISVKFNEILKPTWSLLQLSGLTKLSTLYLLLKAKIIPRRLLQGPVVKVDLRRLECDMWSTLLEHRHQLEGMFRLAYESGKWTAVTVRRKHAMDPEVPSQWPCKRADGSASYLTDKHKHIRKTLTKIYFLRWVC